jgi:trimethylamine--corrinoid protein Co-methyltransferase
VGAAQVAGALFGGTPTPSLGPVTAAKQPGVQSVMEKAIETTMGILAGVRHFGSLATLAFADVGSVVQLMLDVEMMQYFERLLQGLNTDPERLAEEVIAEVAPRGAYFLEHPHTLRYYRDELWFPELMDRRVPAAWMRDPRTMLDHARDKALRLLATAPNRCPLTADQRRELEQIAAAAERESE